MPGIKAAMVKTICAECYFFQYDKVLCSHPKYELPQMRDPVTGDLRYGEDLRRKPYPDASSINDGDCQGFQKKLT